MAGVNLVIILGNLGNDPEMRYMPSGEAVANISIATSETWNDKTHRAVITREWEEDGNEYCDFGIQKIAENQP